nr:integrase, catalytic region, zinc finger, CCHC-type, peptidase aspartic, catalytic [Tanacetum cinerariifolium]
IDNTKTRRPQPRSNTKNDKVPFTSKSSCNKNKGVEVEEHNRNLLLSKNKKYMSSVAAIMGFGDLQWGNILITRVYFVKGLGHNLLSVGQFCDLDLEVAFRRNACFIRNLEGVDLLSGNHTTNLYTINIHEMASASLICLMARASSTKALCYPKNDREDIGKLGAKGDIGFFIGYSADSCTYRIYNRRTKKIMETMNVSFDELSAMAFEQRSSKPRLQSMTFGQINSGLDLTYASSTITTRQPTEGELDLLFEAMYHDYIGG